MRSTKLGCLVAVLAACVVACVADDPTDGDQQTEQQLTEQQAPVPAGPSSAMDDAQDLAPGALSSFQAKPANTCALESLEACRAGEPICVTRCCNGVLVESYQACAACLPWARAACTGRGGPRGVRWQAHW
jgi:hypothetical protein